MDVTAYEIPLSPTPQTFTITLGGVEYRLTVKWNTVSNCWVLDMASPTGGAVLMGIPLVTGADLLAQYAYMNFSGQLVVQTDDITDVIPTFDNLGVNGHLYFVVSE